MQNVVPILITVVAKFKIIAADTFEVFDKISLRLVLTDNYSEAMLLSIRSSREVFNTLFKKQFFDGIARFYIFGEQLPIWGKKTSKKFKKPRYLCKKSG